MRVKNAKREIIVFLVGPTAVGKTQAAVSLAKKLNAEIVSCDSMQIYKGMEITTSMPVKALRNKIPHYLIAGVNPGTEYNVARYRRQAVAAIKDITKRNRVPLFAGGSGHYMSVLIDGIFKGARADEKIRARLYEEAKNFGSAYLYGRLEEADPVAASKIHPNDTKRIIRALEVYEVAGKPISELQKKRKGLSDEYDVKVFCLNMKREALYKRIDERVEKMFRNGLLREVKGLLKSKLSKTAYSAIGIRELKGYLEGVYGLEEAKRLMKRNTRRYAKRQLTWFRKDKRIGWIEVSQKQTAASIANRIMKEIRS